MRHLFSRQGGRGPPPAWEPLPAAWVVPPAGGQWPLAVLPARALLCSGWAGREPRQPRGPGEWPLHQQGEQPGERRQVLQGAKGRACGHQLPGGAPHPGEKFAAWSSLDVPGGGREMGGLGGSRLCVRCEGAEPARGG